MALRKTVKIYGYGWVGKAMHQLFPEAKIHDPSLGMETHEAADVAFVCVPTPLKENGRLDINIVDNVVHNSNDSLIVIRSTVNPGDTSMWSLHYKKRLLFQPEYLGETPSHPLLDPTQRPFLIIGGEPEYRRELIDLYTSVYNANVSIRQMTAHEAEVVKLTENRAIAFKVIQMHELYLACEKAGIDYYTIRDAVYGDDPRFNLWFTMIYDQLGFESSKCLSKDVPAWSAWAKSMGVDPQVTDAIIEASRKYAQLQP